MKHFPKHSTVADLDYVRDIHGGQLARIFEVEEGRFERKIVADPSSKDGESLFRSIEESIESGNQDRLKEIWEYIKRRRARLRRNLNPDEMKSLDQFISEQTRNNVFILPRGSLEDYLPAGYRDKDLDKLIRLVSAPDFWEQLPSPQKEELEGILAAAAKL